ncbi:MAG: helix-turn-helix domain-containing protein, partial [Cloacibacillus sp.]
MDDNVKDKTEGKKLSFVQELSDIWRRYDQVYSRWAERHGLSTNAMSLVEELQMRPEGMEPAAVADYLGVPRQTMTSTLDALE